jgi:hypothetical protein
MSDEKAPETVHVNFDSHGNPCSVHTHPFGRTNASVPYVLASRAESLIAAATAPMILSEEASVAAVRGLLTAQKAKTDLAEARIAELEDELRFAIKFLSSIGDEECDDVAGRLSDKMALTQARKPETP